MAKPKITMRQLKTKAASTVMLSWFVKHGFIVFEERLAREHPEWYQWCHERFSGFSKYALRTKLMVEEQLTWGIVVRREAEEAEKADAARREAEEAEKADAARRVPTNSETGVIQFGPEFGTALHNNDVRIPLGQDEHECGLMIVLKNGDATRIQITCAGVALQPMGNVLNKEEQ